MLNDIQFPKVFVTGEMDYPDTEDGKKKALADAFYAWASVRLTKAPEGFGAGMIKIREFIGALSAVDTELEKFAIENGWLKPRAA